MDTGLGQRVIDSHRRRRIGHKLSRKVELFSFLQKCLGHDVLLRQAVSICGHLQVNASRSPQLLHRETALLRRVHNHDSHLVSHQPLSRGGRFLPRQHLPDGRRSPQARALVMAMGLALDQDRSSTQIHQPHVDRAVPQASVHHRIERSGHRERAAGVRRPIRLHHVHHPVSGGRCRCGEDRHVHPPVHRVVGWQQGASVLHPASTQNHISDRIPHTKACFHGDQEIGASLFLSNSLHVFIRYYSFDPWELAVVSLETHNCSRHLVGVVFGSLSMHCSELSQNLPAVQK
mmetsp:Transcript_5171/g.12209  ORF Transcript_5171/g.12209 Transcript_5171/m.12209 type:complete len:289 (+) Transcript_5171:524-1390(+)